MPSGGVVSGTVRSRLLYAYSGSSGSRAYSPTVQYVNAPEIGAVVRNSRRRSVPEVQVVLSLRIFSAVMFTVRALLEMLYER